MAASIFAVVFGVALQQLDDSINAGRGATVQADLRRIGQDVLGRIAQDLRSTQAQFVGVSPTNDTIEFAQITGYDASNSKVILEGNTSGSTTPTTYRRYTSMSPTAFTSKNLTPDQTASRQNQILTFWKGDATFMGGTKSTVELTRELAPDGFKVKVADTANPFNTGNPFPSSGTVTGIDVSGGSYFPFVSSGKHLSDERVVIAILVQLRRRMGWSRATGDTYVVVNMQTEVALKSTTQ